MSSAVDVSAEVRTGVAKLKAGGVIAFPTDTLYALGADASLDSAVERVFAVKGREEGKPLPLFVSGLEMANEIAEFGPQATALTRRFWPGALTVVVRCRPSFRSLALVGGETVALRAPDHPVALDIISRLGRPVTATSANRSGGPDPVAASEVRDQLGDSVDLVVDGGACPVGRPSTIVDCTVSPPRVLREGAISREEIERVLAEEPA